MRVFTKLCVGLLLATTTATAAEPDEPAKPVQAEKDKQTDKQDAEEPTPPGILSMAEMGKALVSVSVEDANVYALVRAVGQASEKGIRVETRNAEPIKLTFSVKEMPVAKILDIGATLAGCRLYVLPDRFLITPPEHLMDAERKVAERYSSNLFYTLDQRSNRLTARLITQMLEANVGSTSISHLSRALQDMLQRKVDEMAIGTHTEAVVLPLDTVVTLASNPNGNYDLTLTMNSLKRKFVWLNSELQ